MPLIRREYLHISLLLLCVPMQYFLSTYFGNTNETQRSFALKRIFTSLKEFKQHYLKFEIWNRWYLELFSLLLFQRQFRHSSVFKTDLQDPNGESPAIEVIKYRGSESGFFAESVTPRYPRPLDIRYRIGQVVVHKIHGYRGVIIGWDPIAKAPQSWLHAMHPQDKPHWRKMPNYAILVDTRDRLAPQKTYVPEENIVVVTNTRIIHPLVDDYFENFDGGHYLPRPWLKALYPQD